MVVPCKNSPCVLTGALLAPLTTEERDKATGKRHSLNYFHACHPGRMGLSFLIPETAKGKQTELEGIQKSSSASRRHASQIKWRPEE